MSLMSCLPLALLFFLNAFSFLITGADIGTNTDVGTFSDLRRLLLLLVAYLLAVGVIVTRYQINIINPIRFRAFFLFFLFAATSILWSSFPRKIVVNLVHYLGVFCCCLVFTYYWIRSPRRGFRVLALLTGGFITINVLISNALPSIGIHAVTGRWQGLANNPNLFAPMCLFCLWATTGWLMTTPHRRLRTLLLGAAIMGISLAGIAGARSTTTFLSGIAGAAVLLIFSVGRNQSIASRAVRICCLGLVGLTALSVIFLAHPELATKAGLFGAVGKDSTLTGRTELWGYADYLISQRPWLGWSFDSLATATFLAQQKFGFKYFQFHNGYLDLLVKGGLIGAALIIYLYGTIIGNAVRAYRLRLAEAPLIVAFAAAILVHNIAESSFSRELHFMWICSVLLLQYGILRLLWYRAVRRRASQAKVESSSPSRFSVESVDSPSAFGATLRNPPA